MPTKTLLYSAEIAHLARHADIFGIQTGEVAVHFSQVMARKNALIKQFADYRKQQLSNARFKFLRAQARFLDPHTLSLTTGESITARHFVIATGSVVAPPSLPQLKEVGYLTSDGALTLTRLPKSLIVLGGGAVAVEAAQMFSRFGVKVALIQRSDHILREFDTDAVLELQKALRREDMTLFTGTTLLDAWREGSMKGVTFQHAGQNVRVVAEEILFAQGRVPNISGLCLDQAGVFTENGRILTNTEMQTTASHVYAAGDCTGTEEIVHIAIAQGEIAAHNIAHPGKKRSLDLRLLTVIVFTDPHLARVGLTEKQAQARQVPYLAASYPFNDHGKSLIMEALDGFVKLLADPASGEIIGGCVAGPLGGELIHEIVAAMHKRMTVHELAAMPHYHPTLAEIWTYPAEELASKIPQKRAHP
jgi:pyruvate/2-oxoglutarate dehydrogenase complex dihydrolipoamide dehydrogenase (E3) component